MSGPPWIYGNVRIAGIHRALWISLRPAQTGESVYVLLSICVPAKYSSLRITVGYLGTPLSKELTLAE